MGDPGAGAEERSCVCGGEDSWPAWSCRGLCLQPPAPLLSCETETWGVRAVLLQGRRVESEMREMDIFLFNTKKKRQAHFVLQLAVWAVCPNMVYKRYRHPTLVGLGFSFICRRLDDDGDRSTNCIS